jgi:hypothetical protein
MEFNFSNDLCIEYGTNDIKLNVTDLTFKKQNEDNISHIPKTNESCDGIYGDPARSQIKNIFITTNNCTYKINHKFDIFIDYKNKIINIDDTIISKYNMITQYKLCVMAIFKNETMNLKLWLDHYLWQGVEHFYLIDNGSTDNPLNILNEYIQKGVVTYHFREEKYKQAEHYRYVFDYEKLKEKTKWLCICDLDEFIFGIEKILSKALNDFNNYDVIYTNSFFYGSDNLIEHPKDIRTAIVYRESDIINGIKYIFKPNKINSSSEIWIHWIVNPGTVQKKQMNEITQNNIIRLNHYRIQSLEYFTKIKMTRGDVSTQESVNIRTLDYFNTYTKLSNIKDDILKNLVEFNYTDINTAVIIEPRFLKYLPFVINDFKRKLGVKWKIVFYCGKGLKNVWIDLLENNIEIRELEYNSYNYFAYCDLLKSKKLWESLYGNFVLVFAADSFIINEEPYTIEYFMELNKSLIGGNQSYKWTELYRENINFNYYNFHGGLSLRKRHDMIKIIDNFDIGNTCDIGKTNDFKYYSEDVYFTIGCHKLGLPLGDDEKCSNFSVHTIIRDKFFGANRLDDGYYINLIQRYQNICDNVYLYKKMDDIEADKLVVHFGGGFFSNCTMRLFDIILFFNATKNLPIILDNSRQFDLYKSGTQINDITQYYFSEKNIDIIFENKIDFKEQYQYIDYKNLKFKELLSFIKKYFNPSQNITDTVRFIENKYFITSYDNICVLFYRGNDKSTERELPNYDKFIKQSQIIYSENKNINFLIQSDEIEFIQKMQELYPNNSFYFKDEIRVISKNNNLSVDKIRPETNFIYSQYYLSITLIMAKCKYIICTTGNCSLWISLFRGNADNLYQIN